MAAVKPGRSSQPIALRKVPDIVRLQTVTEPGDRCTELEGLRPRSKNHRSSELRFSSAIGLAPRCWQFCDPDYGRPKFPAIGEFKTFTSSDVHHHRIRLCAMPNSHQNPRKPGVSGERLGGLSIFDLPSIQWGRCDAKLPTPYARKAPNARHRRKRGRSFS